MFSIICNAESPRTPFDLMYTHMERAPLQFQLDNGCNLHSFPLAREPNYFADMRVLIDEPHNRNHTNCSANYNTGTSCYSCTDVICSGMCGNSCTCLCITWYQQCQVAHDLQCRTACF
jgi:hypothetical protein